MVIGFRVLELIRDGFSVSGLGLRLFKKASGDSCFEARNS